MKSSMKLQYAESFQMQISSVFVCMYNLVEVNKKITQILTANLKQSYLLSADIFDPFSKQSVDFV